MRHISIPLLCTVAVLFTSCSINKEVQIDSEVHHVYMGMADFLSEQAATTKAEIRLEANAPQFYWQDTDEVGIFPDQGGYQLGFSLAGQGGQKIAAFNGGGWALRSDAAYSAYYPFRFENKNPNAIPIDYRGQTQNGNSSLDHLGDYYFSASEPSLAENGTVSFTLENISSIIQFSLTVPEAKTYTDVFLVTDSDLFTIAGTYDLKNFNLDITPSTTAKTVSLGLNNITTTAPNQLIRAYMMVAPFDLTGHSYKVYVKASDNTYYSADLAAKNHVLPRKTARGITATVQPAEGPGVTLNMTTVSLKVGELATLIATVNPCDAASDSVTWSSSDPTVATVANGVVLAKKSGTATITASVGNKSAKCIINVSDSSNSIGDWEIGDNSNGSI